MCILVVILLVMQVILYFLYIQFLKSKNYNVIFAKIGNIIAGYEFSDHVLRPFC